MKKYRFHEKWGQKYGLPSEAVDNTYSLIDKPVEQIEYLKFIANVTEWWDDSYIESIPTYFKKNCKTIAERVKAEQKYREYLSAHLRGDKRVGYAKFQLERLPAKAAECTWFQNIFFSGRRTGRDISRVKDIGDFQSYLQQKYLQTKGQPHLLAYYLHHLIDYSSDVCNEFSFPEIINRNRDRVKRNTAKPSGNHRDKPQRSQRLITSTKHILQMDDR